VALEYFNAGSRRIRRPFLTSRRGGARLLIALGRTTKAAFAAAWLFVTALAMFFWLGNRVSEINIASVGTIKTAVNLATQYVEDIKPRLTLIDSLPSLNLNERRCRCANPTI
jgi:hypothetical protein